MAEVREEPDEESEDDNSLRHLRMPGAFHTFFSDENLQASSSTASPSTVYTESPPSEASHSGASTPTRSLTPVLPSDPEPATDYVIEDAQILPTKRIQRPKTCMRFAHPPPPTRPLGKKGILRPRVLLQLQQRSGSGFHKPIYDVLPASRFAPVTKIGQKLQRLRKERDGLAVDDLVVLRAEDYKTLDTHSEDIDFLDGRDVLGIISSVPGEPDSAMISLENGVWKATAGLKEFYTFVLQGEHSQTARWYIPVAKRKSVPSDDREGRKFYFANMDPNTKKHPAIASMTASNMDIYDEYVKTTEPEGIIATDDLLRKLIIVSGSWVFFKEGWSSNYKCDAGIRPPHNRTASMPVEAMRRRSTFCTCPARSPTRSVADDNIVALMAEGDGGDTLTPPVRSSTPASMSLAEDTVQSAGSSFHSSDQTMVPSNGANTTEHSPEHSRAALPLPRAATDTDIVNQKRRSWNGHDLSQFTWQSAKGSLTRRMSTKGPKNVTFIDHETTVTFKTTTSTQADKGGRSMRHLRRISQSIRRPAPESQNAKAVDFQEVKFSKAAEPQPIMQADGSAIASTESIATSAVPPEHVPNEEQHSTAESNEDASQGAIAAASEPEISEPSVQTPSLDEEHAKALTPLPMASKNTQPFRSFSQPLTPKTPYTLSGIPAESTDNLVSAVKYTYWQQFDRLLERQLSPPPASPPPFTLSPPPELLLATPVPRSIEAQSPLTPTVASPKSPVHTGSLERKPTWKEKLKHKLHV
jgi:hypothetical protein